MPFTSLLWLHLSFWWRKISLFMCHLRYQLWFQCPQTQSMKTFLHWGFSREDAMGAGGSCQGGLFNLLERQYYGLERKSGLSGGHLQGDRLVCTHSFEGLFWEESLCSAITHLKERDGEWHWFITRGVGTAASLSPRFLLALPSDTLCLKTAVFGWYRHGAMQSFANTWCLPLFSVARGT